MPAFRRVDADRAGPRALGILVPQGEQTLVIVRPRPLAWDLLPARWNGDSGTAPAFCRFTREEAAAAARRLHHFLETCVSDGGNPIETFGDVQGRRFQVWLRGDEYFWILCRRAPGQAYQPIVFASQEEASQAALQLVAFLWPDRDANQELYFNTQRVEGGGWRAE